jgi:tRNA threonylcarbamoyladenosine biosynthesis protein TsaE
MTERAAGCLARRLRSGDVVDVSGELGVGKTVFVRGACRALGVGGPITSPTYTIGHRYEGRVAVSHVDLYRLERLTGAEWADIEPLFDEAIAFVEWPEAGRGSLPSARVRVALEHLDWSRRLIRIDADDPAIAEVISELEGLAA